MLVDISEDFAQLNTGAGTTGSTTASYQLVPGVADFEHIRKDPRLPCYRFGNRTRNQAFSGRTESLRKVEEHLLPVQLTQDSNGIDDLKSFAICGMGGLGKSEIATEFMYKHHADFDAVFWLQADQATTLQNGFSHMAVELGLEETESKDQDVSIDLVKAWLAQPVRKHEQAENADGNLARWLIIFDNVDDPEDLNDYWPQFGRGSVLITSRDPTSKRNVYSRDKGSSGIDLPPLTNEEGAKLLIMLTDNDSTAFEQALAVTTRLEGLPLGIIQMAGVINRRDYTFEEFLRHYNDKSFADLHALSPGWRDQVYTHNLASVFALEQLAGDSASAATLLDLLSVLHADAIPETLFMSGNNRVVLTGFPTDEESYHQARLDLTRRSLVTRNKQQLELRVHRVTQDVARAKWSTERLQNVFNAAVHLVSAIWPFPTMAERHNVLRWQACEDLLPHVVRMHELYGFFVVKDKLFGGSEAFARLLTDAAGLVFN